MSIEQVNAFYDFLMSEQAIYEQYYNQCCIRGFFGICDWDKAKIVNFANNFGYSFNENELEAVLFGSDTLAHEYTINSSESQQLSDGDRNLSKSVVRVNG
ncbi:MAG: Nif11-like leader peptide family natural product precursor [Scytonema sp. PMC 1069.18]|nr:Nif11-like leader peptide family natural product precursor [Scytonema sp. PMC 1069.18]MEC4884030.1 Nif11-like leader peptide family natural product precursor [Scytonema sp. PMC 1070.18]